MIKPNFIIAGAAKAGTTSVYHYLNSHPDVYMCPIKEPHYFCKDIRCRYFSKSYQEQVCFDVKKYLESAILEKKHIAYIESLEEYAQLFREQSNEKIAGEISTGYLYSQVAAEEIYKFNSDAKIVIILRNPIERAFSHWVMALRRGGGRDSFLEAIYRDQDAKNKGWGRTHLYVDLGLYYEQIKRYLDVFPRQQVLVLFYEELNNNPSSFFMKLFEFLQIVPFSIDTSQRHNSAAIPKYPFISEIIKKSRLNQLATKWLPVSVKEKVKGVLASDNLPKLTVNDSIVARDYFDADIALLEKLIGRDLSAWRLNEK